MHPFLPPVLLLLLLTTSSASPFPYPELSPKPNATTPARHNPHKEPTPTFKLACDCAKPIVPIDQLTASEVALTRVRGYQKCEFEFGAAMACYYRSRGGCASPTFAVRLEFPSSI
ncbi:hypothetical protein CC78DRAFT_542866 [Lojkania enalia]|uniref:Uncharacterized protein n=1 Tax=Lojkania enalia TaxID=147567 RepID=A0A9P4N5B4_9PLEO|nr:hypothetical protein CC78DRAFT_542866 [Didymosphaeria enalia]